MLARLVKRELLLYARSRALLLVALLLVAPLAAAAAMRGSVECSGGCLAGALELGGSSPLAGFTVYAWSWIIALILGMLPFAVDVGEGMVYYILPRGVPRGAYAAVKLGVLAVMLLAVYVLGFASAAAGVALLGGRVDAGLAVYALLYAVSSLPLALSVALLTLRTGSSGKAAIIGFVGWLATSIAASIAGLVSDNPLLASTFAKCFSPFADPRSLPQLVYAAATGKPLGGGGLSVYVTTGNRSIEDLLGASVPGAGDAAAAALATAAWIAVLAAIAYRVLTRRDF